jgi:hypothetical protein
MDLILQALRKHERRLARQCPEQFRARSREWTERRVRAIWEGDARRIEYHEMTDLEAVAAEAARAERKEYLARSERLARFISAYDEAQVGEMA